MQNERDQDSVIIEGLVRAAVRGVKVHIMAARPPLSLKKEKLVEGVGDFVRTYDDVGIKIHKLKGLKLHGKMLLADGVRAIIGSINRAPGSFHDRRELAIEVYDEDIVERLHKVAKHDWETPIDSTFPTKVFSPTSKTAPKAARKSSRSTSTRKRSSITSRIATTGPMVEGSRPPGRPF